MSNSCVAGQPSIIALFLSLRSPDGLDSNPSLRDSVCRLVVGGVIVSCAHPLAPVIASSDMLCAQPPNSGDESAEVVIASALHLLITLLCVGVLLGSHHAIRHRAEYLLYIAGSLAIVCLMHVIRALLYVPFDGKRPVDHYLAEWRFVDSTFSIVSSAVLLAAWYVLHARRFCPSKKPNVSAFAFRREAAAAGVMCSVMILAATIMPQTSALFVYCLFDVLGALAVTAMVGYELLVIRLRGSVTRCEDLFSRSELLCWLRWMTFGSFLLWAGLGSLHLCSGRASAILWHFPTGMLYYALDVVRIVAVFGAVILAFASVSPIERSRRRKRRPIK